MNEHIKAWLEALRSGEYKQVPTRLRTDEGYCCLGVACDLIDPSAWVKMGVFSFHHLEGRYGSLPTTIQEDLGISSDFGMYLAELNDRLHFDFNMIADYIEGKVNNGSAFK